MLTCQIVPWNQGEQGATSRWEARDKLSCRRITGQTPRGVKLEGLVFVVSKWKYWLRLTDPQPLTLRCRQRCWSLWAGWVSSDSWPGDWFGIAGVFHAGMEYPIQVMPWNFTLLLSCKGYCPGGFVFGSFIAACNEEIASTRCFIVLWNAENTESVQRQGSHS